MKILLSLVLLGIWMVCIYGQSGIGLEEMVAMKRWGGYSEELKSGV